MSSSGGTIYDVCNGSVGEGRGGGFSEDDGRRLGMEYVNRGFSIISGASTNYIFSTIFLALGC